jgi:L-fuconolactonase
MEIIDTHLHIWNLQRVHYAWLTAELGILYQNYEVPAVAVQMKEANVAKAVLVQAANSMEETDFMLENAEKYDCIAGVVGWLPLLSPVATAKFVEKYKKNAYFKGIRHLIHDEPNPRWLLQAQVIESLQILADNHIPFDVVGVLPEHLECVRRVGEQIPDLCMVLDHLNHPRGVLTEKIMEDWRKAMQEVAENPNVYAKISGLGTVAPTKSQIASAIVFALATFSVKRCLLGGDYPVSLLAATYTDTWKTYQQMLELVLDEQERRALYWENAEKFYNLRA